MSKKIFTNEEILVLSKNRYIKQVSKKGITYTDEFKSLFVAEHKMGKLSSQIFQDAGFDIEALGNNRIKSSSRRWRNAYKESGELGLRDTRKFSSGRPLKRELTLEEIILKAFDHIGFKRGSRSIKMVLNQEFNLNINRKCIQKIMRKYNIKCPIRNSKSLS